MNELDLRELDLEAELWVRKIRQEFEQTWFEPVEPTIILPAAEEGGE